MAGRKPGLLIWTKNLTNDLTVERVGLGNLAKRQSAHSIVPRNDDRRRVANHSANPAPAKLRFARHTLDQSPNTHRVIRESLRYPPFLANGSSFQNLSAAARSGSSSSNAVPILSAPSAERIGPRKMKLSPYDAKYDFVRVQVLAEELRPAGLRSRAQELLHALAAIVGRALAEAVRPAVDFDAPVDAGLVHAARWRRIRPPPRGRRAA